SLVCGRAPRCLPPMPLIRVDHRTQNVATIRQRAIIIQNFDARHGTDHRAQGEIEERASRLPSHIFAPKKRWRSRGLLPARPFTNTPEVLTLLLRRCLAPPNMRA